MKTSSSHMVSWYRYPGNQYLPGPSGKTRNFFFGRKQFFSKDIVSIQNTRDSIQHIESVGIYCWVISMTERKNQIAEEPKGVFPWTSFKSDTFMDYSIHGYSQHTKCNMNRAQNAGAYKALCFFPEIGEHLVQQLICMSQTTRPSKIWIHFQEVYLLCLCFLPQHQRYL